MRKIDINCPVERGPPSIEKKRRKANLRSASVTFTLNEWEEKLPTKRKKKKRERGALPFLSTLPSGENPARPGREEKKKKRKEEAQQAPVSAFLSK